MKSKTDSMKRVFRLLICLPLLMAVPNKSHAQIFDAIKAALIAGIKAADIAVQKAQNATIDLQNAQKVLENNLSKLNLQEIGSWEEKAKDLYSDYFDELRKVKSAISYFQEVSRVIAQQSKLVTEYKQAYRLFVQDKHFSSDEINYIYNIYTSMINASIKDLDQIILVLSDFSLQMTDAARLKIIKDASAEIERVTQDLRNFNNQAAQISLQRAKNQEETKSVMRMYGLKN